MNTKRDLRERYLEIRSHITESAAADAANQLAERFIEAVELHDNDCVGGYIPIGSEINILPLLQALHAKKIATALPKIAEKNAPLHFKSWSHGDPVALSRFHHVYEPLDSADDVNPTILLVPLVAFDKKGNRLGFGGGYYDRTLAAMRENSPLRLAVGVGFACQEAAQIPQEPYDQTLDIIVSERCIIK